MLLPERINPIIKLTEKCNYKCSFCRYANHRQNDDGVSEELINKMVLESIKYNIANGTNNINVIFHGGEPLLYGHERLLPVLKFIQKNTPEDFSVEYSVQTNSSLITEEWIKIFKKYGFDVGISLDGPPELNGHMMTNSEDAVKNALDVYRTLKEHGVHCGFLSVITNSHLSKLNSFFDFLMDNDIDSIGLCYCYSKMDGNNVDPEKLGKWLIDFYELYFSAPKRIHIREFDMITRRVLKHPHNACSMSCRKNCGTYLTLTPNGYIEFCDDYDLDFGRKNALGNLYEQSLEDIVKGDQYQLLRGSALDIVEKKCKICDVYTLCRGGCARNDVSGQNYFCETFKTLYPYIERKVLSFKKND